jgi:hypothetical protein
MTQDGGGPTRIINITGLKMHRELTVNAFIQAYENLCFTPCADSALELGFEKIVLYGKEMPWGLEVTHAARQLTDGRWTSKLGACEDVIHTSVDDLNGPAYGNQVQFLKKAR